MEMDLYREDDGPNRRTVRLHVGEEALVLETQDVGPEVEKWWGDWDYEFWTTVPRQAWGQLLAALVVELMSDDPKATDRLREICKKHGVEHGWSSYA